MAEVTNHCPNCEALSREVEGLNRAKLEGTEGGCLVIDVGNDGDVWVTVWDSSRSNRSSVRFCTVIGGGNCGNVRNALKRVMQAMKADGGDVC